MQEGDDEVAAAVRRLLRATQDFTRAYEAWVESPRSREPERRNALERAESRLTHAREDVVHAQQHKR